MDWKGILVIASSILVALMTSRWWLPPLLVVLSGKRIKAKWGGKDYALAVEETDAPPPPNTAEVKELEEGKELLVSGWYQRLPEELIADKRQPVGVGEKEEVRRINKAIAAQLRAATVLIDGRESFPPGSEERIIIEDLVDSILSRDANALDGAKAGLGKMMDDEEKLRSFHEATRMPMRILRELSGGPPAGRTGKPRKDSEIRDDLIISLYAAWRRLASEGRLLRGD